MFVDWKSKYGQNDYNILSKAIYRLNIISIKLPMAVFTELKPKKSHLHGDRKELK